MNSFGLGLVLSFVDNASAGMTTATSNFNRMSTTADSLTSAVNASATEIASIAFSLSAVGDTFTSIGESIMGVFTGITEKVIDTGGQMLNYRMQMTALYGSAEAGEAKMEEIKDYAMSSVFAIESLIPAVTMMKAVGIEALEEITTSSGSATQKLLDYASDLAAMMPNMRNVYGTGVEAAMGAFKEYIAEGNAMSLKRGAGLDITAILGEDKGSTIEERTQQIADLIDTLNIVGYTAELAGTPTQRLSNIQDALFNTLSKIADSGVFEVYVSLLEKLSDWLFTLVDNEETFNLITGVLADTITTLLSPLQSMLDWVIENSNAIIDWIKENPELTKNILVTVAAIGAFLIVAGNLLKILSSIAFAVSGAKMLGSLPIMFGKLIIAISPFIALAGIAYTVWGDSLEGIKDKITWFFNNIGSIFTILSDAWGDNALSIDNFEKAKELGILPLVEGILQLKYYWDFFVEGFKNGLKSFFEGFVGTLEALGIDVDELATKFFDFIKTLTQPGAEETWIKIGETLGKVIAIVSTLALVVKVLTPVFKIISAIGDVVLWVVGVFRKLWVVIQWLKPIAVAIIAFFKDMGAAIALMKEGFGFFEVMGAWFPKLAGFFKVFGGLFLKIGAAFTKLGGWIVAGLKAIGSAIAGAVSYIAGALGISVGWVVAIIVAVIALITLIIVFRKQIGQFFVWLWDKIATFFPWIGGIIANFFVNLWGAITTWFSSIIPKVKEVLSMIVQAILNNPIVKTVITIVTGIVKVIWSIIKMIGTVIAGIAKVIWAVISGIAKVIWAIVSGLVKFIVAVVQGIWGVIKAVANLIWTIIKTVAMLIWKIIQTVYQFFRMVFLAILALAKIVITGIVNFFKWLWSKIKPILQAIGDFFKKIFNWVKDSIITPVVNWIVFAFNWVKDKIVSFLKAVGDFFSSVFNWINNNIITPFREFMGLVFDWIADKVDAVTEWISNAFEVAADWIKDVFNGVADFFTGIWEGITKGATAFFDWIADALGWVVDALSTIGDFFGGILDSAGGFFSSIGDGLADFVGLDTGGYVKTTGIAVLHPNEVVVNDETTRRLQNFLSTYEDMPTSGSVTSDIPQVNNSSYIATTQNIIQTKPLEVASTQSGETHNDYSVTFSAGSINIQLSNASDAELEKAAEKIMKIIARKQELRAMAVRK